MRFKDMKLEIVERISILIENTFVINGLSAKSMNTMPIAALQSNPLSTRAAFKRHVRQIH